MDAFTLHQHVLADYDAYVRSFLNIADERVRHFVEEPLRQGLAVADFPVRFARYTGQESLEEKAAIQNDPPHVLLTNYVMLELMLTRPHERVFVDRAVAELQFLVLDELHTYSGRQGADVAMLVRRLRERCGNPDLLCIGTSATSC